ncbi:MAG: NADH:flavin oxidoreductase [Planctomycetia bacterium]|nr:NADH:flavin oxidoreductase [Planctomycetia bacterium]
MTDSNINNQEIFNPKRIGGVNLRNSILRAATHEALADQDGKPTQRLHAMYRQLAKGGVGAIITGFISVSPLGKTTFPGMLMLDCDAKVDAFRQLVQTVHEHGAPIIAQLAHCGRHGVAGRDACVNRMTSQHFLRIINDFTAAALRAQHAGFDAVELHVAHGYLLSEILSPRTNRRNDDFGGDPIRRAETICRIIRQVKASAPCLPIWIKFNAQEKKGMNSQTAVEAASLFKDAGVDALEISCGMSSEPFHIIRGDVPYDAICHDVPLYNRLPRALQRALKPLASRALASPLPIRMYNRDAARAIKAAVQLPTILVGGVHDLSEIQEVITSRDVDAVSMCRPLICEPNLVKKYQEQTQTTAKCRACNRCIIGILQRSLRCYHARQSTKDGDGEK